jgi:excinuclease ABC subunit A
MVMKTEENLVFDKIHVKGAKVHNLKNIDVEIPRKKLVIITGLSGSGKSSLAFDTLYAEGQRRYVESLSSYARQFLDRISRPKVDFIKGLSPAIAIQQKGNNNNPRSTVGTSTEIYDYLKLLFTRIGRTYSPITNKEVKRNTVTNVVDYIKKFNSGERILLLSKISFTFKEDLLKNLDSLLKQGYNRVKINSKVLKISEAQNLREVQIKSAFLVIDRIIISKNDSFYNRITDSIETAVYEGHGRCIVESIEKASYKEFNTKFERDGLKFLEPNINLFSYNNPFGACPKCEGYGDIIGIDRDIVFQNKELSIYENAIFPWRGKKLRRYKNLLIRNADKFNFPIHKPYYKLTASQKEVLWEGNEYFIGLNQFFSKLEKKLYKIQNRVMLSRYRGKTKCNVCNGNRLRAEANYIKINKKSISDIINIPISELLIFFNNIKLTKNEKSIANRILSEIQTRVVFLNDLGLGYLTLNRKSKSLSGGESQRINLATSLGSNLVGSLYILDEPSIGLHPNDTKKLVNILKKLRDLGNTVIVVEHDEEIIKEADYIIDIGPMAGSNGGEIVAKGNFKDFIKQNSLTANYIGRKMKIELPQKRRRSNKKISIIGARENNLKNINVDFPLNVISVITGVSGSGKSTLVNNILYPAISNLLGDYTKKAGEFNKITGDTNSIEFIELVTQNPIGRSSRSNPVTYIKAYDDIRKLYALQKYSVMRGFKPKHFSFNVDGGRCEKCKGEGQVIIEMQFMADVHIKCDACNGKRFIKDVLEVTFKQKNIDDILNLTVDEAIDFFDLNGEVKIKNKLQTLKDVGLGYVKLGQSSSTLSGGEAQRIKLASFLGLKNNKKNGLFIFDEPTTGLHYHDINKLLRSINSLIEKGNTVIIVEHNIELIKCADHLIDLGPKGGNKGGEIVAMGKPEEIILKKKSITAKYLRKVL